MAKKATWIITALWIICVIGIVYDAWVIVKGHAADLSLYAPACGVFAEILRRLDKLSPGEREFFLKAVRDQGAFSDEAIKRRAERYLKHPMI